MYLTGSCKDQSRKFVSGPYSISKKLATLAILMMASPNPKMMSHAIATESWLCRPSIRWGSLSSRSASCYWNQEVMDAIGAIGSDDCYQLSYMSLILVASQVVIEMRQQLRRLVASIDMEDSRGFRDVLGIPVVVAIPEGPLLPLATLVVHALNAPTKIHSDSTDSASFAAIFVPIEPSEAERRNLDILQDVLPAKILAVPGEDMSYLEALLSQLSALEPRVSSENHLVEAFPELIDFSELVCATLRKAQETDLLNCFDRLLSDDRVKSLEIQTLVTNCADYLDNYPDEKAMALFSKQYAVGDMETTSPQRISHIVFTSGTTGKPKGCISSIQALQRYISAKNVAHGKDETATVLLASALSFDPCLSDILASFQAKATLAITPRVQLLGQLETVLKTLKVTHILCTPSLWSLVEAGSAHAYNEFPFLRVIALGGEPIPKATRNAWARTSTDTPYVGRCRLFATYGVTEACVYQTCGEVFSSDSGPGQLVGLPLLGMSIRICDESNQDSLNDVERGRRGEVVLLGDQCDGLTGYLKRPELSHKFHVEAAEVAGDLQYCYRTGDRGTIDLTSGKLRILGRIVGEEGMVKINGVRVELGEIEAAVVDDGQDAADYSSLVLYCCAKHVTGTGSIERSEIHAFCVLSSDSLAELGAREVQTSAGMLVNGGPLLELLRSRCSRRLKKACIPTSFVLIPRIPLSPTGKRDRTGLPALENCQPLDRASGVRLKEYGSAGQIVAETIIECLNLQPPQEAMVTVSVTFSMLGGDSLAATRVTRALYAYHHQVENTRFLGGSFGQLDGPFDVVHLLRATTLGDYVDMLDRSKVGKRRDDEDASIDTESAENDQVVETKNGANEQQSRLYDALLQATTLGHYSVALALLDTGTDPNFGAHGGRLGKVSGRLQQKAIFRSSPLHLACIKGHPKLVKKLLAAGSKSNSPDASGLYPLHLAASGMDGASSSEAEDLRRLECVEALFASGVPRTMRDGNKQSVLHAAARAGHHRLLRQVMHQSIKDSGEGVDASRFFDWTDRWFRTPVHWAILNGRVEALRTLLSLGCSATPPRPKVIKRSSAAVESPMELCERLYGVEATGRGSDIRNLLLASTERRDPLEEVD